MSTLKPSFGTPNIASTPAEKKETKRPDLFGFSGLTKAAFALGAALTAQGCAGISIDTGLLNPNRGIIDATAARMDYDAQQRNANEARRNSPERQTAESGPMSEREARSRFAELTTLMNGEMIHPVVHHESIGEFTGGRELYSAVHLTRVSEADQERQENARLSTVVQEMVNSDEEALFSVRCTDGDVRFTTRRGFTSTVEETANAAMCRIRGADLYQTVDHSDLAPGMSHFRFSHQVEGNGTNREEAARQAFANLSDQMMFFAHSTTSSTAYGNVMQQRSYAFDYHTASNVFHLSQLRVNYTDHPENHTVEAQLSARIELDVPSEALQNGQYPRATEALRVRAQTQEAEELEQIRHRLAAVPAAAAAETRSGRHGRHGHHEPEAQPATPATPVGNAGLMPVQFGEEAPAEESHGRHGQHGRRHGNTPHGGAGGSHRHHGRHHGSSDQVI